MFISTFVNNHPMKVMIDTGASYSFINADYLHFRNDFVYQDKHRKRFVLADGLSSLQVVGTVQLNIMLGNTTTTIEAFVAKRLCTSLIVGMDYLSKYDLEIRTKTRTLFFHIDDKRISIPINNSISIHDQKMKSTHPFPSSSKQIRHRSTNDEISSLISTFQPTTNQPSQTLLIPLPANSPNSEEEYQQRSERDHNDQRYDRTTTSNNHKVDSTRQQISNLIKHIADDEQHRLLELLLTQFERTFDTSQYTTARTPVTHIIETHPHTPPVSKCYPSNPKLINEMRQIITKLLQSGLVRPSKSPYAAAALLTKKKDQTWRLVIDYKKLNSVTIKDNYPLPNIEVTLQTLGNGYHFFSKLDLRSGFWQLPIEETDRHKTAFVTPFGLFEWNVLPQGLRNAPPSFQRVMSNVLSSCTDFSLIYLDDIIIFSRSFEEHLDHIRKVLDALADHHLVLTPTKCEIAKQHIEYLGHLITPDRIVPLPDKVRSILLLPEPRTLAQANKFIGSLSWYRKFLPGFASLAAPIHAVTNLSKSNRWKFKWTDDQSKSFHGLKLLLTSSPLFLNFPSDSHSLLLSTDASTLGIGGILFQEIDGEKKILYYHSEVLTPSQKRYHPIELEALAIFKCMNRMRSLLLGRSIVIFTDNCPICHMMEKKVSNKRVEKISLLLQEFNIDKIIHVQGKANCLPDYLSRNPIPDDDDLIDTEYGLGFARDQMSSSMQLLGAVTTRSKTKMMNNTTNSSSTPIPHNDTARKIDLNDPTVTDPPSTTIEHFDVTRIKEHQLSDTKIRQIISNLQSNPSLPFRLKDGVLCKLVVNQHDKTERALTYVPSSMIESLLHSYHDNRFIGSHFGIRRTLNKIQKNFWWPEMKKTITSYIKSCLTCQAYNIARRKRPGFLHPIEIPDGPNQLLGMDFCGPFPTTPDDNRYVLCITDYYTKFVTAIALPTCTAMATAEALFKEHICRYGVPKAIISDQGTSFKNDLMKSVSELIGFHHILCTPYHPQGNGLTERFNATFVIQLAKLTDHETNNWDQHLPAIVFAYNTGLHSTTNFSPFELLYGRQANLPTDPPPKNFTFSNPNDYFDQLSRSLKHYRSIVKKNVHQQQKKSKFRYDYHRSNLTHEPGTIVLTRNFKKKSKLDPSFSLTPKTIVKCNHPVYMVRDPITEKISRIHINDLRALMKN